MEKLKEVHWKPHHAWAGEEMYSLCVDMRGFYLKVCLSNCRLLSHNKQQMSRICCSGSVVMAVVLPIGWPVSWSKRGLHATACM